MPNVDYRAIETRFLEIHQWISRSNENADLAFAAGPSQEWPDWYRTLLTKLLIACNDKSITYLTSNVGEASGDTVIAFTEQLVARATVERTDGADAVVQVVTWGRRALSQISLQDVDPFPRNQSVRPIGFPQHVRLELHYYGQDEWLRLPLGTDPSRTLDEETVLLHTSLVEDLTRAYL